MTILYIVLGLIAIPFIISIFMPGPFSIVNEVVVNQSKQQVFDYLKILRNQEQYSKWVMTDPNMRKQFTGTDGTVGFIYAWQSDNKQVGQGEQEIIKLSDGEMIENEIRFLKPFDGISYTIFETTVITPVQTRVKWTFSGKKSTQ